jgi:hypothetical protein
VPRTAAFEQKVFTVPSAGFLQIAQADRLMVVMDCLP